MNYIDSYKYGFIKPALDAHTLGVNTVVELLKECSINVVVADDTVARALNEYKHEPKRKTIIDWIVKNKINRLGISYRLDEDDAVNMVGYLIEELKNAKQLKHQGGNLDHIYFGGLPKTCLKMEKEFKGLVKTFFGGESVYETLTKLGVPEDRIPHDVYEGSKYDETLLDFGKTIIDTAEYLSLRPIDRSNYPEYGTRNDTVQKRISASMKSGFQPLMRAHVGPYNSSISRWESVNEFLQWSKSLASTRFLDILSIGSSQLTQSNFGEEWGDMTNGGGVPVNSPEEYRMIWEASRPLLVRTYSGTKNIPQLAHIHEETLNISWHALSLWWFNQLDERGPNDLYTNLKEHMDTIKYIAGTDKPFEANVSHHFAFRGADDVTYIVSAFLAAKLAKKLGIKVFILQNMLNTPRLTWGIQDLAKSRALIKLIRTLEDNEFKVVLQPRAGLDYFKPDLYEAKIQLAAVAALMDDIDPHNELSPPMIHVVSYSEASHLATPEIIDESIQITQYALMKYRQLRKSGLVDDMSKNADVTARALELFESAMKVISSIESNVRNTYSPEGFYKIFASGYLPVPYLWGDTSEFKYAVNWKTKPIRGSVRIVDKNNNIMKSEEMIAISEYNLKEIEKEFNLRRLDETLRINR